MYTGAFASRIPGYRGSNMARLVTLSAIDRTALPKFCVCGSHSSSSAKELEDLEPGVCSMTLLVGEIFSSLDFLNY